MSTRANIIIKDKYDKLFFYRHSDGYPEGTLPTLTKFIDWVQSGLIRDNVGQAAGWLIMLGNSEYEFKSTPSNEGCSGWKVGAYEPTAGIHGDIEYLYVVDLEKKSVEVFTEDFDKHATAKNKSEDTEPEMLTGCLDVIPSGGQ